MPHFDHPNHRKLYGSASDALEDLKDDGVLHDGMTLMVGGFGLCGIPEKLIAALRDSGVKGLTCISNNAGVDDFGLGLLLKTRQIKKMVSSYVGENAEFERQYLAGELEVEFNPQGTLAERIRAGGAGIPAFYTATGAGTPVAEGKESRELVRPADSLGKDPRAIEFILETGLYAHVSLVKAHVADQYGNLIYRKTARNFNQDMATAGAVVIAEVDEITDEPLDPDLVHTPGSYVDRVVKTVSEKRIEQRTVSTG